MPLLTSNLVHKAWNIHYQIWDTKITINEHLNSQHIIINHPLFTSGLAIFKQLLKVFFIHHPEVNSDLLHAYMIMCVACLYNYVSSQPAEKAAGKRNMTLLFDQWYMSACSSFCQCRCTDKWTLEVTHKYSYSSHSTKNI